MPSRAVSSEVIVKYPPEDGAAMCEITVVARCHPTEDTAKVAQAIANLFPDAVFKGDDPVVASAQDAQAFAERLIQQRIRSAARAAMLRGVSGSETTFHLNKQVAAAGKVSFSEEEHPLGDLEVTIRSADIRATVGSLTATDRPGDEL
jgi:predicted RNA binding protein with dsRBD fold (UPF0201 family)